MSDEPGKVEIDVDAAAKLDALWGAGAAENIKACVEQTNALIKAAEEQPAHLGLRVYREDTGAAALCVGAVCQTDDKMPPDVGIDIDLKHKLEKPDEPDLWIIYVPDMTSEQHAEAEARWEQYRTLMSAAAFLQQQAHGILTGSVQKAVAERRAASEARRKKSGETD